MNQTATIQDRVLDAANTRLRLATHLDTAPWKVLSLTERVLTSMGIEGLAEYVRPMTEQLEPRNNSLDPGASGSERYATIIEAYSLVKAAVHGCKAKLLQDEIQLSIAPVEDRLAEFYREEHRGLSPSEIVHRGAFDDYPTSSYYIKFIQDHSALLNSTPEGKLAICNWLETAGERDKFAHKIDLIRNLTSSSILYQDSFCSGVIEQLKQASSNLHLFEDLVSKNLATLVEMSHGIEVVGKVICALQSAGMPVLARRLISRDQRLQQFLQAA